ncbi:MAG: hypothetical protein AB7K68_02940 [Bacteriovoracia bacterium]
MNAPSAKCAVLFSGGTDSTCVAALLAASHSEIHLLTFFEEGTKNSPIPKNNILLLEKKFPAVKFVHRVLSTDSLVKKISYEGYLKNLWRHGFFLLATPGFSTLSWHSTMIAYCRREGISAVADGLTRELMHFPGHMDAIIGLFRKFYAGFGIEYKNPVREWDIPPDQQFLDRLIVDHHAFFSDASLPEKKDAKTTGAYLFSLGLTPAPDVKGTDYDRRMQHDCYPFVLYNIFAFWMYLPFRPYAQFENRLASLFREKIARCEAWLQDGSISCE